MYKAHGFKKKIRLIFILVYLLLLKQKTCLGRKVAIHLNFILVSTLIKKNFVSSHIHEFGSNWQIFLQQLSAISILRCITWKYNWNRVEFGDLGEVHKSFVRLHWGLNRMLENKYYEKASKIIRHVSLSLELSNKLSPYRFLTSWPTVPISRALYVIQNIC